MTATDRGFMMRFMEARISSRVGRKGASLAEKSTTMRTSTAVAPSLRANTGLRSISLISGKSSTNRETFWMMAASASRSTGSAPRTPRRISAAAMPSIMERASSRLAGARRKVMSFKTSTNTPPSPNATSLPKLGSVTAPTMTSWAWGSICCTCTPVMSASAL